MALKKVQDKILSQELSTKVYVPSEITEAVAGIADSFIPKYQELRADLKLVSDEGVSLEDAERLAAKFADALLELGGMDGHIQRAVLDAKLKKGSYKTFRAKVYLDTVNASEKKPTETMIESIILTNADVSKAEDAYHKAEEYAESLKRTYDVFRDVHIYFRGVAKGAFNGS